MHASKPFPPLHPVRQVVRGFRVVRGTLFSRSVAVVAADLPVYCQAFRQGQIAKSVSRFQQCTE